MADMLLCRARQLVAQHIDKRLEEPCVLSYIWRIAIWPGLRLDYKGRQFTVSAADDDGLDGEYTKWHHCRCEAAAVFCLF